MNGPSRDPVADATVYADPETPTGTLPSLGVVIVCFNSGDVILDCLESLLAATGVRLHIVVVDNASTDDSVARIKDWASGAVPYMPPADLPFPLAVQPRPLPLVETHSPAAPPAAPQVLLLHAGLNGGYAAGVNAGLACLAKVAGVDRFWVLNPDSAVPSDTPRAFAEWGGPDLRFSLMGGRVNYLERPDTIQLDGGVINWRTGATRNVHQGQLHRNCPAPDAAGIDFVSGANMVASRQFYEARGPMREDYFLYYEEVDWAMQRGDLPLAWCPGGVIFHRAGTSIGSQKQGFVGSSFSLYFLHRNRLRFLGRHRPGSTLTAHAFSVAKACQVLLKGHPHEARVLLQASLGLPPPPAVRRRLSPQAARVAFGRA